MKQHTLWPVRVATTSLDVPLDYHDTLSRIVIGRYKQYSANVLKHEKSVSLEQVNNGFFSLNTPVNQPFQPVF